MTFTNTFKRKVCRVIAALAAVACTMSLAACGADETGKIRIGIKFDQPGLGFKKSGTYVGFDVDVAKYIAKKLGYSEDQIIWKEAPSKQREAMIQTGDVDMILATYSITDERKKAVDFSSSYYNDSQSVVVKKDSKFANATKVSDLKDATVGVMVGTLAYDYAKANIKDDIQTFNDDAALAQALDAGQIDALVTSTVECVYMVQSEQVKDAKVLGRLPDSEDKSGMGIVLPKDSKLTAAVTKAVDDLNADGTIKKLQDKWLAEYTTDLTELKK